MHDRNTPSPSSSTTTVVKSATCHRNVSEEQDGATCGCTCKLCCAAVIADCVAVCCCPCAVVNILALVLVKLPYAVARKCIRKRKEKKIKKCCRGDRSGISKKTGAEEVITTSEKDFSTEFKAEDVWLELCNNFGHLGFGRVSFSGSPSNHGKGN